VATFIWHVANVTVSTTKLRRLSIIIMPT
jgi:hypothetical protein